MQNNLPSVINLFLQRREQNTNVKGKIIIRSVYYEIKTYIKRLSQCIVHKKEENKVNKPCWFIPRTSIKFLSHESLHTQNYSNWNKNEEKTSPVQDYSLAALDDWLASYKKKGYKTAKHFLYILKLGCFINVIQMI